MHFLSTCFLLMIVVIAIHARIASSPSNFSNNNNNNNNNRLCPEQYRELRRRQDEASTEMDGDDDVDESRESICEQAMSMVVKHRNFAKLNPSVFLHYCPHYDERLALVREKNNTLCENKLQELRIQQQNKQSRKKRSNDFSDTDDNDDKRRSLYKRELKKDFALRFIRKRMS